MLNNQLRIKVDKTIDPIINLSTRNAKKQLLKQLNETQARQASLYINSDVYWRERSDLIKHGHKNVIRKLKSLEHFIDINVVKQGAFKPEINENGCEIKRSCFPGRGRYHYDSELSQSKGWTNYECQSDAPYFGIWVNVNKMEVLRYCEGDLEQVLAPDPESFKRELLSLVNRYQPEPSLTVIDAYGSDQQFTQNAVHDYLGINVMYLVKH
ncbi:MAG: hypothetical protein HRU38_07095 [Saccharospirillaceae bacterium]|nr:hypothetical protein [Saccharospirillaceae bacterium]